jgi:hypothetical protein
MESTCLFSCGTIEEMVTEWEILSNLTLLLKFVKLVPWFGNMADRSMTCNTSLDSDLIGEAFYKRAPRFKKQHGVDFFL